MRYHRALVGNNVVIVGGGIAGLAASVYLARAGKTVTIFERRRNLGGRAVTQLRHGYRFNLGPHAVYRGGASSTVYRELGVPIRGGSPPNDGTAVRGSEHYALPASGMGVLTTGLLGAKGKTELASLMLRIKGMDLTKFASMTVREWLDEHVGDERLREVVQMFMRVATYAADDRQSAAVALQQLRIAQDGVIYIDEGGQKIVDSLHSSAVAAGVDVALSKLPVPKEKLAFGVDRPFYFSVHSEWAQLTPKGGALVHAAKYRKPGGDVSEMEL